MERLLWLYGLPYDPRYPLVCFDERPCYLIGETVAPLNLHPGQVAAKEHYAYSKNGSCCLLAAIEPLTGARPGPGARPTHQARVCPFPAGAGRALPAGQEDPSGLWTTSTRTI